MTADVTTTYPSAARGLYRHSPRAIATGDHPRGEHGQATVGTVDPTYGPRSPSQYIYALACAVVRDYADPFRRDDRCASSCLRRIGPPVGCERLTTTDVEGSR